ncbi:hypothetical protein NGB36_23755 [Streptomyces sp. RB6PN25]|uniref:Integral membrane protein n=1 Tax=Streptomyces humicola TaxID=2953240 RepID=A0ABT1Q2D3_9ACTN|nr:hypothetical protein [Streptomyces humicola]MCQ4083528.1 hypothetical protein [Streptomyces humicola]
MPASGFLRPVLLVSAVLVLVEAGIGMVVNLYVSLPASHPGTQVQQWFPIPSRAAAGLGWAIGGQGQRFLAVHIALGLALIPISVAVLAYTVWRRRWATAFWALLGAVFVIASAMFGGSFLDAGGHPLHSLLMALLSLAAALCYTLGVYVLPSPRRAVL